jgi:signal transduction histidine kinase/ActR/RegA family two-component response regulator
MVGTPLLQYFMVEDWGDRDAIRARLGRGEAVQLLARLRHADGDTRWVEVRAQAVLGPDGSLESIIGTMRDAQAEVDYREALAASERQARELVDAFEAARDEAIRASTAKTAFLSRMSHELRTPLNAVLGFAQLLALDPLTPEQAEAVHHIRHGGRHLLDLINEIVDISRIEAGRLSLTMQTVDATAMLGEAVQLVGGLARHYDVTVVAEDVQAPVPHVHADQQRVTQVLLNLTSNAVKYNRPGGSVHVACRAGAPGEVRFDVSDTGPGIPEHLLPRLFEPFDRLGAENSDVEGTGIGLALADALARAMGGRIEVSTTVGGGSTFTLVLRAAPTMPSRVEPVDHEPDAQRDSRLRILYIEDNPTNATLMERLVALRPGCRLQIAANGVDGLAAMLPEPPDLVFLDVHLPDLPGDEVLQRLRLMPGCADVPVVVVTADASPSVRERMTTLGSDGFLTKPLDLADVLGWIDATAAGQVGR